MGGGAAARVLGAAGAAAACGGVLDRVSPAAGAAREPDCAAGLRLRVRAVCVRARAGVGGGRGVARDVCGGGGARRAHARFRNLTPCELGAHAQLGHARGAGGVVPGGGGAGGAAVCVVISLQ